VLADKRDKLPDYEGQYNCNPDRRAAGILERRFARFWVLPDEFVDQLRKRPAECPSRSEQPPVVIKLDQLSQIMLNVDAANSLDPRPDGKVSAVGLMVTARRGDETYVLDDHTKVLGISGTYRAIYPILGLWMLDRVLVEKKALGPSVIAELEIAIRRGWYVDHETDKQVPLVGPDGEARARGRRAVRSRQGQQAHARERRRDALAAGHGLLPRWRVVALSAGRREPEDRRRGRDRGDLRLPREPSQRPHGLPLDGRRVLPRCARCAVTLGRAQRHRLTTAPVPHVTKLSPCRTGAAKQAGARMGNSRAA
jgi:hypothetical protein